MSRLKLMMVMETARKDILKSIGIAVSLYLLICFASRPEMLGNIGLTFGYYGDFNEAKRIVEDTDCFESLKYGLHTDLTLENFHFRVSTKSGRTALIFFDSDMDISQVCNMPKGILVSSAWHLDGVQCYTIEALSERLNGKGFQVRNIREMLCNLDELVPMFEAAYKDESIPIISRKDGEECSQYIQIRIYGKDEKEYF